MPHARTIIFILAQAFMLVPSILVVCILKTHPPVPMLIATKSCPDSQDTGDCAMGGCQRPLVSLVVARPRRVRFCGLGTCSICIRWSSTCCEVLGLVASMLRPLQKRVTWKELICGEVWTEVFLRDPQMIESSRDIPNVNRCAWPIVDWTSSRLEKKNMAPIEQCPFPQAECIYIYILSHIIHKIR